MKKLPASLFFLISLLIYHAFLQRNEQKEQTIRELSSVLQKTSEREQALEIKFAQIKEEYAMKPPRDLLYSDKEFVAMQVAKTSAEALNEELQAQLKEVKKHLAIKERDLNKSNELLDTERKKYELKMQKLEQQLSTLFSEKGEQEKNKVNLEQKVK